MRYAIYVMIGLGFCGAVLNERGINTKDADTWETVRFIFFWPMFVSASLTTKYVFNGSEQNGL